MSRLVGREERRERRDRKLDQRAGRHEEETRRDGYERRNGGSRRTYARREIEKHRVESAAEAYRKRLRPRECSDVQRRKKRGGDIISYTTV